jgi:hypothetical protein
MGTLVRMVLYIKDPRKMDNLKRPQRNFASEEDWEQAILAGRTKL